MKKLILMWLLTLSFSTHAASSLGLTGYIGAQAGTLEAENEDFTFGLLRLGITKDNWAFEVRAGNSNDDNTVDGTKVEIESFGGIYGLYHQRFGELSAYVITGWSKVSFKGSPTNPGRFSSSTQEDEDGFSYGVGIEIYGVNIEWMQYLDTDDIDAEAIAVGYNYYFD